MMWSTLTNIKNVCEVFAQLKEDLIAFKGTAGEKEYYRILREYGNVAHANELKQRGARQASYKLWQALEAAREDAADADANPPAPEAS